MRALMPLARPLAWALALTMVFVFGVAGCAASQKKNRLELFKESVDNYNHAYRWQNYALAANYLPDAKRAAFVAAYDDEKKGIHIEDAQIITVKWLSEDAAEVLVRYRFTMLPSVTLEDRRVLQHWHRVGERWVLENEEHSLLVVDPDDLFKGFKTDEAKDLTQDPANHHPGKDPRSSHDSTQDRL